MKNRVISPPVYEYEEGDEFWFEHPFCAGHERLYWHVSNPVIQEGEIASGEIVPCRRKQTCPICLKGKSLGVQNEDLPLHLQRRHHPTQTPIAVWDWLFTRHVDEGMVVLDPYAGTASSKFAADKRKAKWIGCDANWEFAQVTKLRLSGEWMTKDPGNLGVRQIGLTQ